VLDAPALEWLKAHYFAASTAGASREDVEQYVQQQRASSSP